MALRGHFYTSSGIRPAAAGYRLMIHDSSNLVPVKHHLMNF